MLVQSLFAIFFSLLCCEPSHSLFSLQHPRPVHALDPVAFEGRWFQTHGSMVSAKTFQKNGFCVTVDYLGTESDETDFRVINSENIGGPKGVTKTTSGEAVVPHPDTDPGKIEIHVDGSEADKRVHAWVILLGDKDVDGPTGRYEWAVISDPLGASLFILARDVMDFQTRYQSAVLLEVGARGYIFPFNRPKPTYQGTDCDYTVNPEQQMVEEEGRQ